jgi:hypothetical protein
MTCVNYANGKIYKIECLTGEPDDIYIGSTTKEFLSQRLASHSYEYKRFKNGTRLSKTSSYELFDKYGIENCMILLIESFPCNNKDELRAREGFYIKSIKCVNKLIPGTTAQQSVKNYHTNNKESIIAYKKQYHENNKEILNKIKKEHRNTNIEKYMKKTDCLCGGKYTHENKMCHFKTILHKNYLANNPEIISTDI